MADKNIFKELTALGHRLRDRTDVDEARLKLYKEVRGYVLDGSYSTYDKKREFFSKPMASDREMAVMLDISESAVRTVRHRISKKAYAVLGGGYALRVLEFGSPKELEALRENLKAAKNGACMARFFPTSVIGYIRKYGVKNEPFSLSDCKAELEFLRILCYPNLVKVMRSLDADKLAFLAKTIDGGMSAKKATILRIITSSKHTTQEKTR